jgi:hypothetical protein
MRDGAIVYRDKSHITASYAATFAPRMTQHLQVFAAKRPPGRVLFEGQSASEAAK